jgi:murein L,D-transpeptidase YafK
VAEADAAKRDVVKGLFAAAGVSFPPAQILLRAFKQESQLELWAASGATDKLALVATYGICAASGELGPKRKQGDQQVPEGFYTLSAYNPASRYHLAMQVSYPNYSDRLLGDKRDPGSEIMIHGRCASVGCLAMSDERIQELWVATTALRNLGGVVHVHVFPARDLGALLASEEQKEHHAFWANLKEGLDSFEARRRLPLVRVKADGRYEFISVN